MNVLTNNPSLMTKDGALEVPKLLVVDDDESIRGLLRTRLSDSYQIVETGDPEQALALALEHKPDAILLDLMMPGFSGFELCQSFHLELHLPHSDLRNHRRGGGEIQGALRKP